ncbi:MAG: glycosyltransferase family 2 protein [Candidatus Neptunochlamydia sp.]|nr:glycosyltransferase family 2 protein [Candidatus Neptunochlamydia sp.]
MMKRFFLVFLLFATGFILGFGCREIQAEIEAKREAKARHTTYATQPVMEKKRFVVIISATDNASYCEQNILSVLSQDYKNYRVIYIDNGSTASAAKKARTFLQNHDVGGRVDFVDSEPGSSEGENLYRAVHSCQNHEIVVLLRGDEFLAQNTVLGKLNRYFADSSVWMLGSDELLYSTYNRVRSSCYYQAFYSGLFKQIRLEEFLSEGKFRKEKYEKILFLPLKELAGSHAFEVDEPLFICQEEKEESFLETRFLYSAMKENPWRDFSKDEERVDLKESLDLKESAHLLKETGAYGFYFCLGNHLKTHPMENRVFIQQGVYGWQFSLMEGELSNSADLSRVGLYSDRSKAVSLLLNIVLRNELTPEKVTNISTEELFSFFEQGLKMDIAPLHQLENSTIEISFEPEFIER